MEAERSRANLIALAERCEKASGPDREADCLAWAVVHHGGYEWRDNVLYIPKLQVQVGAIDPGEHSRNFSCWFRQIPTYTVSLDAAMTLVPEGRTFSVARRVLGEGAVADVDFEWVGEAATPALALTAACLRAIAATPEPAEPLGRL